MFLIRNDVSEKSLERMASQVSCHSWSSYSTTSSSGVGVGGAGNSNDNNNNGVPPPSNEVITALIRDLSFWDAIPPANSEDDDRGDFPSPLPQRPKRQQQQQLRRGSSSSTLNSSSRQKLKSQSSFGKQQEQQQQQPQFLLKRGKNVSSRENNGGHHQQHQHHGYTRQRSSEMLQRGSSKSTIDDNSAWRPQPVWKAAVDPMTGRTYYYDAVTRRTQWEKPAEVRQMEKQKKSQRRKRDKLFFQEMEKNIMKSLSRGEVIPGIPPAKLEPTGPPLEPRNAAAIMNPLGGGTSRNFRTLSTMDDTILAELRDDLISPEEFDRVLQAQQQHSKRTKPRSTSRGRPPLPCRTNSGSNGRGCNNNDRSRSRSRSRRLAPQQQQQKQYQPVDRLPSDSRGEGSDQQSSSTGVIRVNTGSAGPPLPRSTSPRNGTDGTTATSTTTSSSRTKPPQQPVTSSGSDNNNNNDNQACQPTAETGLAGEGLLVDGPIQAEIQALAEKSVRAMKKNQSHVRRNTGGTIYVNGTMSNPDVEATIKCICGVYRAHLVQASEEERNKHSPVSVISKQPMDLQLEVFNDRYHLPTSWKQNMQQDSLPSLADIVEFYQEFYRRSQMEFDTIIMSLIYVERLIKTTNLTPGPENWRSVLFSCMVLASKVWDDLSMWNVDFSNVASAQSSNQSQGLSLFTLQRVNQLELILLKSLNFNVRVPASEYAKYYFLIRTMLMKSGLMEGAAKPLGKEEAKKLENRTSQYQDSKLNSNNQQQQRDRRWKSMYDYSWLDKSSEEEKGELNKGSPGRTDKACLEQIVNMSEHT